MMVGVEVIAILFECALIYNRMLLYREWNRDAICFLANGTEPGRIWPLNGIRVTSLSPRSPIGSLSVGGLQDERSAPGRDLLPFRAPTSRRRMVVLSRCSPALGLIPSLVKGALTRAVQFAGRSTGQGDNNALIASVPRVPRPQAAPPPQLRSIDQPR